MIHFKRRKVLRAASDEAVAEKQAEADGQAKAIADAKAAADAQVLEDARKAGYQQAVDELVNKK